MRSLREINWWQLVNSYRWLREHNYIPESMKGYSPYGLTKAKYVEVLAYIMEHLNDQQLDVIPNRFSQLYNWIFMDEHDTTEGKRTGKMPNFEHVVKNSRFGHSEGTQAFIIDEMVLKGGYSTFDIAKAIGSTESRVRRHIMDLRKFFKDEVEIRIARRGNMNVYYVKEKSKDVKPKRNTRKLNVAVFE